MINLSEVSLQVCYIRNATFLLNGFCHTLFVYYRPFCCAVTYVKQNFATKYVTYPRLGSNPASLEEESIALPTELKLW